MPSDTPPPPPAAALAAKCKAWQDSYHKRAHHQLRLAARALEVLVEAMVRIRDAKGDDGPNASGIAFNALRRAAAIVEEVSDEAK